MSVQIDGPAPEPVFEIDVLAAAIEWLETEIDAGRLAPELTLDQLVAAARIISAH